MTDPKQNNVECSLDALRGSLVALCRTDPAEEVDRNTRAAEIERQLEVLHGDLNLLQREHAGMAEELLRAYEQLGIVFEVTRKIPVVTTDEELVRIFIQSLQATYHDAHIRSITRGSDGMLRWPTGEIGARRHIEQVVTESVQDARIIVRTLHGCIDDVKEIMAAPVFSGQQFFCCIVFTHGDGARRFEASDMSLIETLMLFCGDLIRTYHLANELRTMSKDVVRALVSAVDQKDAYTFGHSNRVGHYSRLLGAEYGLSDEALRMLEWAALLHDVGKIGIRDDVLKKPGKLTGEEFEHIKEHPVRSYEVVRGVPHLHAALDGVRHHHERYDGSGYPDRLAGEEIPLQARLILVADIFDALTTNRSYRRAFNWEQALELLREETGRVGDPKLVPLFDQIIRREVAAGRISFSHATAEVHTPTADALKREDLNAEYDK